MTLNLRIALLADPLAVKLRGGRHAAELAHALSQRAHEVRVFGARRDLERTAVHARDGGRGPETLGAEVLSFRPDAVIAYGVLSPAAWLGCRIARRRRVPLVLVEPGSPAWGAWYEHALRRAGKVLWGALVRRTACAVVALDPVARAQAEREGFSRSQVLLAPHGVDLERFRPGIASELIVRHRVRGRILFAPAPRETPAALEILIGAFARTIGQRSDWSLVIAWPAGAATRLRTCAERLGVGASVHQVEPCEADLPGLYASATLVALCGLDDEPSGVSLAHALACGRPVVAADLPRLPSCVRPGETGLLARAGDLAAWTEALRRAALAPEARERWGRNARALAEQSFDWRRIAEQFEGAILSAGARLRREGDVAIEGA